MAPAKSCERSEHSYNNKKPLKKTTSKSPKKHYSAVTIKLNTAPWNKGGIVNEEIVYQIIHSIYKSQNQETVVLHPVKWELDTKCQLHLHTTIETTRPIYRNKTLKYIKDNVPSSKNYSTYIKPISHDELKYWLAYLAKTKVDIRPLYYRIVTFYHAQPQVIEDFSDLADYDVEFNTRSGHFQYIDSCKVKAWEVKYN